MLTRVLYALPLLAALSLFSLSSASAGGGTYDDVVSIEVIDGGTTVRGTQIAGIRLTLKKGWKTYWRSPGDAGIPPQFDWRGSRNVDGVEISWPAPQVFEQDGLRTVGYVDSVVFPLEIQPRRDGGAIRLKGVLDIGICKDVCLPERLRFDHRLDAAANRNPAIVAALAQRPFSAEEAGVRDATCRLTPSKDGLRIEARVTMPRAGNREFAVIEAGDPLIWASEAEVNRRGDVLTISSDLVHASAPSFALDRSQVRLTVLGSSHAVDIRGCRPG